MRPTVAPVSGTTANRALGLSRGRARAWLIASLLGSSACHGQSHPPLYLVAGPEPRQHVEFRPLSSYAEYVVYPGIRSELKITLASYAVSCSSFIEPGASDASATITVISPAQNELGPASYGWAGHAAHGGSEEQPERPYALPTVRLAHESFVLPPGGEIQLESVATTQDGRVRGMLNFEFAGDADHAATSLKGNFEAKLCRVRL